jgi:predicted ATP-dependent endonuclease of OLD family
MIKLTSIRVQGFRLLDDVTIAVEPSSTVIVGRNNSGKTSLAEVFERFLGESRAPFRLEDFSASTRRGFATAKTLRDAGNTPPETIVASLPIIALELTFGYDINSADLGTLSPFIIDLDPACTKAIARVEYSPSLATLALLLDADTDGADPNEALRRHLREAIPKAYAVTVSAIDPTDSSNRRLFDSLNPLAMLMHVGFVKAQRTLDSGKRGDTDVIGKLLSKLFRSAEGIGASQEDQDIASQLKSSVEQIEQAMQGDFDTHLKALLPTLSSFGFPSLNDTELRPQTSIDIETLLSDNTRIFYTGTDGVHLPEGYNGLGTRNLIYILLQLEALHKTYRGSSVRPGTHLVFIEEPEAHLHPQMQEVFIGQLHEAVTTLSEKYPHEPLWQAQFVVSTHSSHLANAAPFDAIRYFLNAPTAEQGIRHTKVKDFRKGAEAIDPEGRRFLQQYMTLTKCDLYFADKAILVEGATERILMPRIIKFVDADLEPQARLGRQYVTTMEVGGAYAQIFYPLLDHLELKTLIITDIDAVRLEGTKYKKCPTALGQRTSNSALKSWFGDNEISVHDLIAKPAQDKVKNFSRIAYQLPEADSAHCARSYEDALILANLGHFEIANDQHAATCAWETAQNFKKSEEAIRFAIMEDAWNVPKYIREGLVWLSEPPPAPANNAPAVAEGEA